ncbi:MAG: class I SAM-dependent methyltransferase [Thermodesulfobacteriota bacterium]|nr:MAG: class I SAM-dependent methyltransferase [Thermodesulfobacteriota bacterium]
MEPVDWEKLYNEEDVEKMPWYFEGLDPDLEKALERLSITSGTCLDLCTGPGTQAFTLAGRGFHVTATDISETAVRMAAQKAVRKALYIEFVRNDILNSTLESEFDFVFDRGCFHTLTPELRGAYIESISGLVKSGGFLFLKCFSNLETMKEGPYRFTPDELREYFSGLFKIISIEETVYHGTLTPLPKALFATMKRV